MSSTARGREPGRQVEPVPPDVRRKEGGWMDSDPESRSPNQFIGPEWRLGTVSGQVVLLVEIGLYVIAMKDKFGVNGTAMARSAPSDQAIQGALLRQIHISQSTTRRN
jgi:hypothetical protein